MKVLFICFALFRRGCKLSTWKSSLSHSLIRMGQTFVLPVSFTTLLLYSLSPSLCHLSLVFNDVPPVCFPITSSSSLYPFFHSHLYSFSRHPSPTPFLFCHNPPPPHSCLCVCVCVIYSCCLLHTLSKMFSSDQAIMADA